MAGPLVTFAELQARPGFADADQTQAEALLDDASALVRDVASGELDDVVPPDTPGAVRTVVVDMVRRGLSNPQGYASESVGDYSYSRGGGTSLQPTRREIKAIRRAVGFGGVTSVPMKSDLPDQLSEGSSTAWLDDAL